MSGKRTKDRDIALTWWPQQSLNGYIKDETNQTYQNCNIQWFTERKNNLSYWVALCHCGNYFKINIRNLKKGATKSCGCYRKEVMKKRCGVLGAQYGAINGKICIKDYTGQKIGELTFIEPTEKRRSGNIIWKLQHDNGRIYYATSWEVINGNITGSNSSFGELKTQQVLETLQLTFYQQYSFPDCKDKAPLRFDFYLPDYNCCIECDGIQHFQPVEKFGGEERFKEYLFHDKIKNEYCKNNNIQLIRIPYSDYKKINNEYIERLINE